MARTEEGEFELVLGNRQLLTVFFLVVVLLGIFFTMGYVVGRNSAPVVAAKNRSGDTAATDQGRPAAVNTGSPAAAADTNSGEAASPALSPAENAAPPRSAPETRPSPAPRVAAKTPEPAATAPEPIAGQTYLQVVAVARPDAELIVDTLQKNQFHALIAPGPNEKLWRVLVGPVSDAADMAQTRSALEAKGFKNPIVRRY